MGSIEFALAPVRSKILAPSCPQLYTTMNMCPMVSAGKKKKRAAAPKRKAAKKMTKHQKIVEKKRKSRAGMTIAQCVCHALCQEDDQASENRREEAKEPCRHDHCPMRLPRSPQCRQERRHDHAPNPDVPQPIRRRRVQVHSQDRRQENDEVESLEAQAK